MAVVEERQQLSCIRQCGPRLKWTRYLPADRRTKLRLRVCSFFTAVFALSAVLPCAPAGAPRFAEDPQAAKIVFTDVDNFIRARKLAETSDDPAEVYRTHYFDRGTIGLRDMFRLRIKSMDGFLDALDRFPDFYDSVKELAERKAEIETGIRHAYANFKDIYPAVRLPSVYFVVGAVTSGGTVSDNGLLIGSEVLKTAFGSVGAAVPVVAHELVHFQQPNSAARSAGDSVGGDVDTLLGQAINEGAADFIGHMISGERLNKRAYEYGLAHEARLWSEFKSVMGGEKLMPWMGGRPGGGVWDKRPRDLGYFIGHQIVAAYYARAEDKQQAIADILGISDFEAFLEKSGYPEKFKN